MKAIFKILDAIPLEFIYRYLDQKNASKKQISGERMGSTTAGRKAKNDAINALTRDLAK